jgi:hypothetical protein
MLWVFCTTYDSHHSVFNFSTVSLGIFDNFQKYPHEPETT